MHPGEQSLPANGSCNLGSLNLAEFVSKPFTKNATFDFAAFSNATRIGICALDRVLDWNMEKHPLPEQREMARNWRNVGLGVFGYADMLMMMGMKYGGTEVRSFNQAIFDTMLSSALMESTRLAKEKGAFPAYDVGVLKSDILNPIRDTSIYEDIKKWGLRNCSLLSIAPTGSLSTMMGRSGGIEPEYAISYKRKTESLFNEEERYYDVYCRTAQEYIDATGNTELPSYFLGAHDIPWESRIETQSVIQEYIDTAISSTVNLPKEATPEDVCNLYLMAWKRGLKGVTVFRDGCQRVGILTTDSTEKEKEDEIAPQLKRGEVISAPRIQQGFRVKLITGCGSLYLHGYFNADGEINEVFVSKGSTGGCLSTLTALTRMISLCLRAGVSLEAVIDQLESTMTCPSFLSRTGKKHDTSKGSSCPSAIGFALIELREASKNGVFNYVPAEMTITKNSESGSDVEWKIDDKKDLCPECGTPLTHSGGCTPCPNCGYSPCD